MRSWQSANSVQRFRYVVFSPITLAFGLVLAVVLALGMCLAVAAIAAGSLSTLIHLEGDPPFRPICVGYESVNSEWVREGVRYVCDNAMGLVRTPLYEWSPVFAFGAISAALLVASVVLLATTLVCKAIAIGSENM